MRRRRRPPLEAVAAGAMKADPDRPDPGGRPGEKAATRGQGPDAEVTEEDGARHAAAVKPSVNDGRPPDTAGAVYEARCARFGADRDHLQSRSVRLGTFRIGAFLVLVSALVWAEARPATAVLALSLASLFGGVFLVLVRRHRRVKRRIAWLHELWLLNDEGRRRAARQWDGLPALQPVEEGVDHPYAADLDLLGSASLSQLLGLPGTPAGRRTLRRWLLSAAPPEEIRARQGAVEELTGRIDLRDELAVRGRQSAAVSWEELDRFLAWAEESGSWLERQPALVWVARVLPVATLSSMALNAVGVLTFHPWAVGLGLGIAITALVGRRVRRTYERAFPRSGVFRHYSGLFLLVSEAELAAPRLRRLQSDLAVGRAAAHRHMQRLERLMELADLRFSQLYLPIQALSLWDIHVLRALERWQREAGRHVRAWFTSLGEVEALSALAVLRHDNPGWAFPEILAVDGESPVLEADDVGHPLLDPAVRVTNDVRLGPPGTFVMVTGSNMSGKSTLLRAIGVNVVLAQAGGPVCASRMRLPPVELHTSMRVADSLALGLSRFMAELYRLEGIVRAARYIEGRGGVVALYLLDEILQGTNTAERRVASRKVLRHLLAQRAFGAVTTHDLDLADVEDLAKRCRPVYFTETFEEDENGIPRMTFDYRLRPGVATSTNALKLVRLIGLD